MAVPHSHSSSRRGSKRKRWTQGTERPAKKPKKAVGDGVAVEAKNAPNGTAAHDSPDDGLIKFPPSVAMKTSLSKKKQGKKYKDTTTEEAEAEREVGAHHVCSMVVSKPMGGRIATIDPIITPDEKYEAIPAFISACG
jgi:hypothetical protein